MNDDNYLMRYGVTIIMAITLFTVLMLFFHGPKDIPQNAIDTVNSFIKAEKQSDVVTLQTLYAKNARINVQEISDNGQQSLRNYDLSSSTLGDLAKRTAATKKIPNSHDVYKDIQYEWVDTRIKVTATRYSSLNDLETPHILLLAPIKTFTEKWYITNEYIVRYASDRPLIGTALPSSASSSSNHISQE